MPVVLQQTDRGVIFEVKVRAGGRTNEVRGEHDGLLKVSVTQVPEKGKANLAVCEVLCAALQIKRSQLSLVAGETDGRKRLLVTKLPLDLLRERLERLAGGKT
ncbi:MAG: DUF167 family protein [Pirellulales bacterium]